MIPIHIVNNLANRYPELVKLAEMLLYEEHRCEAQTPCHGETVEEWEVRALKSGVKLDNNVDRF